MPFKNETNGHVNKLHLDEHSHLNINKRNEKREKAHL